MCWARPDSCRIDARGGEVNAGPSTLFLRCSPTSARERAKLAFPSERVTDDCRKIIELRTPTQEFPGAVGFRHDLRRIARPRASKIDPEIDAG